MDLGDALIDAASLAPPAVVSLVGAGGKTTLMWSLVDAATRRGWRVIPATTTRVGADQVPLGAWFLFSHQEQDKLVGVGRSEIDDLAGSGEFDLVVVEADGARGKVVKAPVEHEPMIPASTTLVVTVIGADALDRVIEDVAHRPMAVAALCGCSPYERLTIERALRLLTSPKGGAKFVPTAAAHLIAVTRVGPRQEALAAALVAGIRADGRLAIAVGVHRRWLQSPAVISGSVNLIPEAPIEQLVELAALAESLGYQRCWVYDEGLATRDVHVTLTALAGRTERLQLGTGITNPYTRHPATTAAAIASLDELSGGRAFLGLGAGGTLTLDPLGLERDRPLETVQATIRACRGLLEGQVVTLDGPSFRLRGAKLGFPVRPDIEIWLAGRGPWMLGLGGELADGVMLDFVHKATLGDQIGLVRAGAARMGRSAKIAYSTMIVTDDETMAATRPHMTYRLVDSPPAVKELIGITDAEVGRIRDAMAGGLEAAAAHVRDEWIVPFVISGSPTECAAELADLVQQHQIDEFVLPVLHLDHGQTLLRQVAEILKQS